MKIDTNGSGISFNKDTIDVNNNIATLEKDMNIVKNNISTINLQIETIVEQAEKIQLNINTLLRIDDTNIADNTTWSSLKINEEIINYMIESNSHVHLNKDVLDLITANDIENWNNKSEFNGSYRTLTDKPYIPSIEGLASEEYVNEVITNLQLPQNVASKEDIPTYVSELENDSEYITKTELEDKNYLIYDDVTQFALKEEIPTKISELEDDKNIATFNDLHGHNNKTVIDGITSEQVAKWDSNTSFDGDYYSLKNRPNIPTHTSNLQNDSGFITIDDNSVLSDTTWSSEKIYQYINDLTEKYNDLLIKYNKLSEEVFGSEVVDNNYLQDIEGNYLQDIEGNYLLPSEESSSSTSNNYLQDIEGNYLQDIEGNYLILKESV